MKQFLFIMLILLGSILNAQSFGQNKVQYRDFDWNYISSPNLTYFIMEMKLS